MLALCVALAMGAPSGAPAEQRRELTHKAAYAPRPAPAVPTSRRAVLRARRTSHDHGHPHDPKYSLCAASPLHTRRANDPGTELTIAQATGEQCIPPETQFVILSFDEAKLVMSNLGGMGGRCTDSYYCSDLNTKASKCLASGFELIKVPWQTQCAFDRSGTDTPPVLDKTTNEYTTRGNHHVLFRTLGFLQDPTDPVNDGWQEVWLSINNRSECARAELPRRLELSPRYARALGRQTCNTCASSLTRCHPAGLSHPSIVHSSP